MTSEQKLYEAIERAVHHAPFKDVIEALRELRESKRDLLEQGGGDRERGYIDLAREMITCNDTAIDKLRNPRGIGPSGPPA